MYKMEISDKQIGTEFLKQYRFHPEYSGQMKFWKYMKETIFSNIN